MTEHVSTRAYSGSWIILLALLTAIAPLSTDMYLPALPQMAHQFGVTTQVIANSLPAYFLGLALGQLIYGPISDRIGRKKPLYFGLCLHITASFLCLWAPNEWILLAARVLQALGSCVGLVIARAAIRDRLDTASAAQAFASMMVVMGVAPIIAPTLGAWILLFFHWQAIFICLLFLGLLALIWVHFGFQETLDDERKLKLSIGEVIRLYGAIFIDQRFAFPMLAGCLSFGVLFSYIIAASHVLMDGYHLNQQVFAYVFGLNAIGTMFLSAMNHKVDKKFDILQRLKIGGVIQIIGAVILVISGIIHAPLICVMLGLFLAVSGIGFTAPNSAALAMSAQGRRAGTASAIMGAMQFVCGLLCGIILNAMNFNPLLNMAILMLVCIVLSYIAMIKTSNLQKKITA